MAATLYRRMLSGGLALAILAALGVFGGPTVSAQGILVIIDDSQPIRLPRPMPIPRPEPPAASYKIKELAIRAKLMDQVAQVNVSQSFVNTGSRQMEVQFLFPLPYDGAIDQLTLMVDGKEYPAKLLAAKEARTIYEGIVRRNQDPALLEWMGTGMFQTSVFPVPPGAERKVTLRYSQLLRKDGQLTDFLFPLSTAKYTSTPIETIDFQLAIESGIEIKNVYSPTHAVEVQRPDDKHAVVKFTAKNTVPTGDFRLFYDVAAGKVGASVVSYRPNDSEDGYFLLLASPQIKSDGERPKKTVIFVVDRSGSMSGKKIDQAKGAVKHVLNNLREGDMFNIVAYDSAVESFRPELEKYNEETRKAAIGFVEGLYPGGGTNIDGAMTSALAQLKDTSRPNYVIFLTDGLPTVGETAEAKIVANAKKNNTVRARVLSFGVGYDLNSRLLDRLVRENFGQSEFVRPDEDIEAHVARLYGKISSPVMTDVAIKFEYDAIKTEEGDPINRMFPKQVLDVFAGEQVVLVGRYRKPGPIKVTIAGSVAGQQQKFDFPADMRAKSHDKSFAFVEKLWAMRRIGDIIDELDLKGKNDELIRELVALSTKHGILTPYTSFLADDTGTVGGGSGFRQTAKNQERASQEANELAKSEGKSGVEQRLDKDRLRSAAQAPAADSLSDLQAGGKKALDARTGDEKSVRGLMNLGAKTFYQRAQDKRWVDASVTEDMEKNAQRVTQFSDAYFKLAEKHGKRLSQYLALEEPMLVNLDGEAWFIDPPK